MSSNNDRQNPESGEPPVATPHPSSRRRFLQSAAAVATVGAAPHLRAQTQTQTQTPTAPAAEVHAPVPPRPVTLTVNGRAYTLQLENHDACDRRRGRNLRTFATHRAVAAEGRHAAGLRRGLRYRRAVELPFGDVRNLFDACIERHDCLRWPRRSRHPTGTCIDLRGPAPRRRSRVAVRFDTRSLSASSIVVTCLYRYYRHRQIAVRRHDSSSRTKLSF